MILSARGCINAICDADFINRAKSMGLNYRDDFTIEDMIELDRIADDN